MRVLALTIAGLLLALPAFAYTPNVGDRAAEISGRDVVSDKVVRLSDYAGKWVFVDFWASWCGPCMDELPNLLAVTRPLRKRADFALFSVSLDDNGSAADLNKVIAKHGIDYPVIYDGNGWSSVQGKEWGVNSIPATFLIDPAGNIVASGLRGEALQPALDFFLARKTPYPPVGARLSSSANPDGSISVRVSLSNPRRTPLKARFDFGHTKLTYADDDPEHKGRPVKYEFIEPDAEKPEQEFSVEFTEFSEALHELTIPAVHGTQSAMFEVQVLLPETESLLDGEGIWVAVRGREKFEPKPESATVPVEPVPVESEPAPAQSEPAPIQVEPVPEESETQPGTEEPEDE